MLDKVLELLQNLHVKQPNEEQNQKAQRRYELAEQSMSSQFEPIQDRLPNDTVELENEEEKDQSHRVELLSKD